MYLQVEEFLGLSKLDKKHALELYNLCVSNRTYLAAWLPWVENMDSITFIENYIASTQAAFLRGEEIAFVILLKEEIVGRIGLYSIDAINKTAEIGYWLGEAFQGKGIITKSCKKLLAYSFFELELNRIDIKCSTKNRNSQKIPEKIGLKKVGLLPGGEKIKGEFHDLFLYSINKSDFINI